MIGVGGSEDIDHDVAADAERAGRVNHGGVGQS